MAQGPGAVKYVVSTLVAGVRSRCYSVRISRVVELLGYRFDDPQGRGGLVRTLEGVLVTSLPTGCTLFRRGYIVYIRCCAENPQQLVQKFEGIVALIRSVASRYRPYERHKF